MFVCELFNSRFAHTPITYGPTAKTLYVSYFKDSTGKTVEVGLTRMWPHALSLYFLRDGKQDITNDGESIKVFSTVIGITGEMLKLGPKPELLIFSASKLDGNRAQLYKRMVSKLAGSHGYRIVEASNLPEHHQSKVNSELDAGSEHLFALKNQIQ